MSERTALVLSAGALFGAYQAGAWLALAARFRPDVVIGVSSGALNAWAIAGGCPPEELAELWLDPAFSDVTRLRPPFPPWDGFFDSARLEQLVEQLYSSFRPRTSIGIVATALPALRPRLFRDAEITWRHLAASCAIPFGFRPVWLDGKAYVDGGLLGALPLWTAAQVRATKAVAIDALPKLPSAVLRTLVKTVRVFAPRPPGASAGLKVLRISPAGPLGSLGAAIHWQRDNIERWIDSGRKDAEKIAGELEL